MSSEPESRLDTSEEKVVALETGPVPGVTEPEHENPVVAWAKAVALGVRDTANDVLREGRRGAREKQEQMWSKYFQKSKGRRRRG